MGSPWEAVRPPQLHAPLAQDDPAQEDPAHDEPAHEEPAQEDPAQGDPAQEDPAQEDPVQVPVAQVAPAQEDPAHDEPAQVAPAHEDPAHDEPAQEDPAHDEPFHRPPTQLVSVACCAARVAAAYGLPKMSFWPESVTPFSVSFAAPRAPSSVPVPDESGKLCRAFGVLDLAAASTFTMPAPCA
jgi:hypothetical protein